MERRVHRRGLARVRQRHLDDAGRAADSDGDCGAPERDAALVRPRAVERADGDGVREDAGLVAVHVHDVEVQPVRLVRPLVLAAGAQAGLEQRVVQLPVVGDRPHDARAVRLDEVELVDVLRIARR
jgi:hypothetical protein